MGHRDRAGETLPGRLVMGTAHGRAEIPAVAFAHSNAATPAEVICLPVPSRRALLQTGTHMHQGAV
jgi:hypothetical protein